MGIELLKKLREENNTYKKMIEFCCDSMILNNSILHELSMADFYFDYFCGVDREYTNAKGDYISESEFYDLDEEDRGDEIFCDVYQYFIISYEDARRIAEYTNEIVYYNDSLDLYILGVTHCGTGWDYVPANWKELEEVAKDD